MQVFIWRVKVSLRVRDAKRTFQIYEWESQMGRWILPLLTFSYVLLSISYITEIIDRMPDFV